MCPRAYPRECPRAFVVVVIVIIIFSGVVFFLITFYVSFLKFSAKQSSFFFLAELFVEYTIAEWIVVVVVVVVVHSSSNYVFSFCVNLRKLQHDDEYVREAKPRVVNMC